MNVENIADILETSSAKEGRSSALGCQHLSMTSYLFRERKGRGEGQSGGRHPAKSNACKGGGRRRQGSHLQGVRAVLGLEEPPALQQVHRDVKRADVGVRRRATCHQLPEEHAEGPLETGEGEAGETWDRTHGRGDQGVLGTRLGFV